MYNRKKDIEGADLCCLLPSQCAPPLLEPEQDNQFAMPLLLLPHAPITSSEILQAL